MTYEANMGEQPWISIYSSIEVFTRTRQDDFVWPSIDF